jgi:hypothetical protein
MILCAKVKYSVNDPEGPDKYKFTERKGQHFTAATWHLPCADLIKDNNVV